MLNMFRSRPRPGKQAFGILPPHSRSPSGRLASNRGVPRRYGRLLAGILVSLALMGLYSMNMLPGFSSPTGALPPLYPEYRLRELALPQHNPDLPLPEGRDGKYVWISEHVRGECVHFECSGCVLIERGSCWVGECVAGAFREWVAGIPIWSIVGNTLCVRVVWC